MIFKLIRQQDQRDSGPTCLKMISNYHGFDVEIQQLRKFTKTSRAGVSMVGLQEGAKELGFAVEKITAKPEELNNIALPCILNWRHNHYIVLYKVSHRYFYIADPNKGKIRFRKQEFIDIWYGRKEFAGICLTLACTPDLVRLSGAKISKGVNWRDMLSYLKEYRQLIRQLFFGFLLGSVFQLIAPFLTQLIVDGGINNRDIQLVYLILIAQLMLLLGNITLTFLRSWILLNVSTRINIKLLTRFLFKLMNLPIDFFETKTEGDLIQRMNDQQKIEAFLTGTALNTFFSLINLLIFGVVLAFYSSTIFYVYLICTVFYAFWIVAFLKPKRELNYLQFENAAMNQSSVIELINGINDIKLNGSEQQMRWDWERLQVSLYKYKIKLLKVTQLQAAGSAFINQIRSILITFLSIKAVMADELTLGGMMAIQYIIGQINNPVDQFLNFVQGMQDTKISLERLDEIDRLQDDLQRSSGAMDQLSGLGQISFANVSFRYPVAGSSLALDNVDLVIPEGKTTAIVGMSGSGKTTIMKLLLKFYQPEQGEIVIGDIRLDEIEHRFWRSKIGTVLPDAFIFSDTIARNIALADAEPDTQRLEKALHLANLQEYVSSLPSGLETRIGSRGTGLSLGQKQRLLIARAVYKAPDLLFSMRQRMRSIHLMRKLLCVI